MSYIRFDAGDKSAFIKTKINAPNINSLTKKCLSQIEKQYEKTVETSRKLTANLHLVCIVLNLECSYKTNTNVPVKLQKSSSTQ